MKSSVGEDEMKIVQKIKGPLGLILSFIGLVLVVYTLLVTPKRFRQCLSAPIRYLSRSDSGEQRAVLPDALPGNHIRLLVNGNEALPAMIDLIQGAQSSIRWQVMLFHPDTTGRGLADALAAAARRGVKVQLSFNIDQTENGTLVDRLSGQAGGRDHQAMQSMLADLRAAGVEVRSNPASIDFPLTGLSPQAQANQRGIQQNACISANHYDHRKILIVDDRLAWMGGMNVSENYLYQTSPDLAQDMVSEAEQRRQEGQEEAWEKWLDTAVVMEGPVIQPLIEEFNWKWEVLGGRLLDARSDRGDLNKPFLDGVSLQLLTQRPGLPQIGTRFLDLVAHARREIVVASPFVSYDPALEALQAASRRGVRVIFIVPNARNEQPISRRIFRESAGDLLDAGVQLYFNNRRMVHTKMMVVDGEQVLLGSFNLNYRSFRLDQEIAVLVDDKRFAQEVVERVFEPNLRISDPVHPPVQTPWNPLNWFIKPFT